jgi:hypothetical protein
VTGQTRLVGRVPAPEGQEWHAWFAEQLVGQEVTKALDIAPDSPFAGGGRITAAEVIEDGQCLVITVWQ